MRKFLIVIKDVLASAIVELVLLILTPILPWATLWFQSAVNCIQENDILLEAIAVLSIISFLLFLTVVLFSCWRKARKREHEAIAREQLAIHKLQNDYHQYLKPIDGQGYSVDTRNGQPVCPKCDKDGHLTYMSRIDEKNAPPRLYCYACKTSVWKDGNFPRKKRKQYEYIP